MLSPQLNLYFIVVFSFLLALMLSVYPLPMDMRWWRPEFVLVVAIYWIFFMPLTVSFTLLCVLGLFQDLLEGVGVAQLTDNWVQGMAGRPLSGIQFLYPALTSALLWPVCHWWLNGMTHRYHQ